MHVKIAFGRMEEYKVDWRGTDNDRLIPYYSTFLCGFWASEGGREWGVVDKSSLTNSKSSCYAAQLGALTRHLCCTSVQCLCESVWVHLSVNEWVTFAVCFDCCRQLQHLFFSFSRHPLIPTDLFLEERNLTLLFKFGLLAPLPTSL